MDAGLELHNGRKGKEKILEVDWLQGSVHLRGEHFLDGDAKDFRQVK